MASRKGLRAEARASRLIAQRETGPWSPADQRELERWLCESTLHRVAYYRLNIAWKEAGRLKALRAEGRQVMTPAPPEARVGRHRSARWYPRAAAACALLIVAGTLGFFRGSLIGRDSHRTGVGGLEAVQMTDGSRIMLNTNTRLRIRFSESERRVDLDQGEVFLDVAKDAKRPFVVRAGERRVVAVGTQFVVRRDGGGVRVAVTEGAVRLEPGRERPRSASEATLLPAGTTAGVEGGKVLVRQRSIPEIERQLTWRTGILTFNRTPLAEAVDEINRYNTRRIVIRDPRLAHIQVGGTVVATKGDSFLRLLQSGFPVRVIHEEGRIVIDSR